MNTSNEARIDRLEHRLKKLHQSYSIAFTFLMGFVLLEIFLPDGEINAGSIHAESITVGKIHAEFITVGKDSSETGILISPDIGILIKNMESGNSIALLNTTRHRILQVKDFFNNESVTLGLDNDGNLIDLNSSQAE